MRKLVCPRLPQFQACVSPLGQLHTRPLFGGYSLAIDDTVFAMVAEGNIYLKACEELGVAPGQALAVEDSFNGIRSAYAAGLYTVMVPDQLPPTEEILALVDKKCDSLTDLQAQLPEILAVCGD